MQHRHLVAVLFHSVSLVLGIPSTIAFLFFVWESLRFRVPTPARKSGPSGDQLIDLLVSGFRLLGRFFEFFAGATQFILLIAAAVSFVGALLAVLLFMTGRGINSGRSWARVLGIGLALVSLVVSLLALTAVERSIVFAVSGLMAVASVYIVWTLGWRFT